MAGAEATVGRRMPVRTVDVKFEWEGVEWWALMRKNPPSRLFDVLTSGKDDEIKAALNALLLDWDFVDEEGKSLPKPADDGLGSISYPHIVALIVAYRLALVEASAPPKESSSSTEPG